VHGGDGDDATLRLAVRVPSGVMVTAAAYELSVEGDGLTLESLAPGELLGPVGATVAEHVPLDGGRRWLGVTSLEDFGFSVPGPGTLAVARVRRTATQPFEVVLHFHPANSVVYGPGGAPLAGTIVGGRLVYRRVGQP
jgi:hypothetical protein